MNCPLSILLRKLIEAREEGRRISLEDIYFVSDFDKTVAHCTTLLDEIQKEIEQMGNE